jgi:hypothetical protein
LRRRAIQQSSGKQQHEGYQAMNAVPEMFPVRTCQRHGFYAGQLRGGRNALIGQIVTGHIIVVVFDAGGHLLKVIRRALPTRLLTARDVAGYHVDEEGFQDYLRREFGYQPGLIRVQEFRLPEELLAVYHMPEHYEDFLKNPNDPSFADWERQQYPALINRWIAEGSFILEWGNSFWMDSNGDVAGS